MFVSKQFGDGPRCGTGLTFNRVECRIGDRKHGVIRADARERGHFLASPIQAGDLAVKVSEAIEPKHADPRARRPARRRIERQKPGRGLHGSLDDVVLVDAHPSGQGSPDGTAAVLPEDALALHQKHRLGPASPLQETGALANE
jgi:hypothetical protein